MSPAPQRAHEQVPPPHVLREYALIADGERGALVGPRGEVAWLCAPHWDSPAVLSSLLGGRSHYQVAPLGRYVWGGSYEPGSLVWRNRWVLDDGTVVECADALALPAEPGRLVLLRRVQVLSGRARVRAALDLRAGFDQHPLEHLTRTGGHGGDGAWIASTADLAVRWRGGERARAHSRDGSAVLELVLDLEAGQAHDLVLEVASSAAPSPLSAAAADPVPPDVLWEGTRAAWASRVPAMPQAWSPPQARHSLAVLHGLTSSTGAMVAAATTSLPERAEQHNSYDYRYAWVRDQCYAGTAAYAAGSPELADAAVDFVTGRLLTDGPGLAPAYTTGGDPVPEPADVPLPGYPGGVAATGNHVRTQFQLDGFGEALQLLATARTHDRLDEAGHEAARIAVSAIAGRWEEPDAGVWELDDRWWTHSRFAAVSGLRAWAAASGPSPERPAPARVLGRAGEDALALADAVMAEVAARCTHPSGRWQRAPDDERVDAALLLGSLRGAVPTADPRSAATLAAVQSELDQNGYVFRFRHDARPLDQAEGAFLLCSYWTALVEARAGQSLRAVSRLEKALAACGPPELYSEEYDPVQHQMRGNLPQAFVHALALEACVRMPRLLQRGADEAGSWLT